MPSQALALALAASIYPPAVAAVIALGRGAEVRSRVFAFVLAAGLVTYAVGALILYALVELGATGSHHLTPGAAVDVALGVLLMLLAVRLHRRRPDPAAAEAAPASATALQNRALPGEPAAGVRARHRPLRPALPDLHRRGQGDRRRQPLHQWRAARWSRRRRRDAVDGRAADADAARGPRPRRRARSNASTCGSLATAARSRSSPPSASAST